jgi:hypothetical protein
MGAIITNFKITQEKMLVYEQLAEISSNTAGIITSSESLRNTTFQINYKINKINYTDKLGDNKSVWPKMIIDSNKLITYIIMDTLLGTEKVDYNSTFYKSAGTTVVVANVETTGRIVIKNA